VCVWGGVLLRSYCECPRPHIVLKLVTRIAARQLVQLTDTSGSRSAFHSVI